MSFKLTIVTPDKVIYEKDNVNFVTLPGKVGQFGVLEKHTPLLSALKEGKIVIEEKGEVKEFDINKGFAEVLADKVTILTTF